MGDHHTTPDQLDQWFRHASAEGMPQHEHGNRIDTGVLMMVLVGLSSSLLVVTIGVAVFANGQISRLKGEREADLNNSDSALAYRASALDTQSDAAWIDRAAGTVRLPIAQAQQDVLEAYRR